MPFSNLQGKVDPVNGKKGVIVSLDVEEYTKAATLFGFPRIPGDDGPGELVQSFDEGTTWNVRWMNTGNLGNYYTGAYKIYHLRIGANNTDKTPLDLALRDFRQKIESGNVSGPVFAAKSGPTPPQQTERGGIVQYPNTSAPANQLQTALGARQGAGTGSTPLPSS